MNFLIVYATLCISKGVCLNRHPSGRYRQTVSPIHKFAEIAANLVTKEVNLFCQTKQKSNERGYFYVWKKNLLSETYIRDCMKIFKGDIGIKKLAEEYHVSFGDIQKWRDAYQEHGVAGLNPTHGTYTDDFKVSVIEYMHNTDSFRWVCQEKTLALGSHICYTVLISVDMGTIHFLAFCR